MPNHTGLHEWPRLFQCLRVPKQSLKEMAELVTQKKQRSGDDRFYAERAKDANEIPPGGRLPSYYPKRDADHSAPPTVTAMGWMIARTRFPLCKILINFSRNSV